MKRLISLFFIILLISGCNSLYYSKTSETRNLIGTVVKITIVEKDKNLAVEAINEAFSEIERIENFLSIYKDETQVYSLNEKGFLRNASDELIYLLKKSIYFSKLSEGAFDVTVQPILDLYKESFEVKERPPTDWEVEETLNLIGSNHIIIDGNDIRLRKNMKITLGGIAKGYIIDKAIEVLNENGIEHALIDAGGDIRVIGKKDVNQDWSIALKNPRDDNEYITIIKLNDNSVATSGDYERYFDDEMEFHHIVDPRTGYSATDLISVTIMTSKAIDADALATSVFVLGPKKGLALIESLKDVEGLLIKADKEIIKSSGFEY